MFRYVLIESRDPFESRDVSYFYGLARDLAAKGEQVTLFLVQNGALAARRDGKPNPLASVVNSKIEVLVDTFSLKQSCLMQNEARMAGLLLNQNSLNGTCVSIEWSPEFGRT